MMDKSDAQYYSHRLAQEQEAAERASPVAAEIHRQLAERYAGVIAEYGEQDQQG